MPKKTNEQIYEEAERALIGEAIAETEQEIFDDALKLEPDDNNGDRSLEEMDGEDVLDDDDLGEDEETEEGDDEEGDDEEGEDEEIPPQQDDRQPDRRGIPPGRLRETADRARTAEAERETARAEARELRGRLEALERGQRQPQRSEHDKPQEPDMFADPEGWANNQRAQITRAFEERRINGSFAEAEEEHGEKFVTAFKALQGTGNPNLVSEIVNSHNPGKLLMRWHERQALMGEIGNDPAAYRERVRQELLSDPQTRQRVITGARQEALRGDGSGPRTRTRLPPSLNSATGGTSHRSDGNRGNGRDTARTSRSLEQEIFESAFED
jgi:hypothetical protein